jgi:hypothetical protein
MTVKGGASGAQALAEPLAYAMFRGAKGANAAVASLVEAGFEDDHILVLAQSEEDEAEWVPVAFRSGMRFGIPVGIVVGILVGVYVNFDPQVASAAQLGHWIVGAIIGAPLGGMTGAVAGLGHWSHAAEFPSRGYESRSILVGVDLTAERHEPLARKALGAAGAARVQVCERSDAEGHIQSQPEAHEPRR